MVSESCRVRHGPMGAPPSLSSTRTDIGLKVL